MLKKILFIIVVLGVLSQAVYVRPLSERTLESKDYEVDQTTIDQLYDGILDSPFVLSLDQLKEELNNNSQQAFHEWGNRMGIGNSSYFSVKGSDELSRIEDGVITLASGLVIDSKFIFGNELRDASRLLRLEDFESQNDLNTLTASLNEKLRSTIDVTAFKSGDVIEYVGAIEVFQSLWNINDLKLIPAQLKKR